MLKHLVDIMIRALGWGTGILIMSVCFISFIVWEIKHHPKQFRITVFLIVIILITINMEPDMAASHIPFQLVPKLQ